MMERFRRCTAWLRENASALLFVGSLAAVTYGFWLAWEPLGYIVPGGFLLTSLVAGHLLGVRKGREEQGEA